MCNMSEDEWYGESEEIDDLYDFCYDVGEICGIHLSDHNVCQIMNNLLTVRKKYCIIKPYSNYHFVPIKTRSRDLVD